MPATFSGPAWGRDEVVAYGAPPKQDAADGYEHMPGTASLIRRNPRKSESVLLRKTRSFALARHEGTHGWQPSGNDYSCWVDGGLLEVRCKPPRELAEVGPAWATAVLQESKCLRQADRVASLDYNRLQADHGLRLSLSLTYNSAGDNSELPPTKVLFEAPNFG
eukprot:SAG31_NODE_5105_length_2741_cov_1.134746_5_plen_164_part_00